MNNSGFCFKIDYNHKSHSRMFSDPSLPQCLIQLLPCLIENDSMQNELHCLVSYRCRLGWLATKINLFVTRPFWKTWIMYKKFTWWIQFFFQGKSILHLMEMAWRSWSVCNRLCGALKTQLWANRRSFKTLIADPSMLFLGSFEGRFFGSVCQLIAYNFWLLIKMVVKHLKV